MAQRHDLRIAVPLYGSDVSPRFCFADRMLLVDAERGRETSRRRCELGRRDIPARLGFLSELAVDVLACGGFNRRYLPLADRLGILVIWGLDGPAWRAVEVALDRFRE